MSLSKFFSNGISRLFGNHSSGAPHKNQTPQTLENSASQITIKDIQILEEACLQMKEISQVVLIASDKFARLDDIRSSPELKKMVNVLSDQATDIMINCLSWSQQCENIRKNSAIVGAVDQKGAPPMIIEIASRFSQLLSVCFPVSKAIFGMKEVSPIERGNEIETRLTNSIKKGLDMSGQLQELLTKVCNAAPTRVEQNGATAPTIKAP